jgi:beta-RFAP synthase
MILEGIVTTRMQDGRSNIAPMGPEFDPALPGQIILKPFETSQTFENLRRHGEGVFHLTDDVLLLARSVIGTPSAPLVPAHVVQADRLVDCCRYLEFRVRQWIVPAPRARILCDILHEGRVRDFVGLNRAKHAVVEAAILASRVGILPTVEIIKQFGPLRTLIEKTGTPAEHEAIDLLERHVRQPRQEPSKADSIRVVTGSRLHLGFLATPHENERAWGGVGLMVKEPRVEIIASPSQNDRPRVTTAVDVAPGIGSRAERILTQLSNSHPSSPVLGIDLHVAAAPAEHVGLGAGTQLTLAIAEGVARSIDIWEGIWDAPIGSAEHRKKFLSLAVALGRGKRSAIGIHGFLEGGWIVDAGKLPEEEVSPKVLSMPLPTWALMIMPALPPGPHGPQEDQAIAREVTISPLWTRELSDLLLRRVIPLSQDLDCVREFGLELARFNRRVGEAFASIQGGPFAHPLLLAIVEELARVGWGASQSSWGPTLFVPTSSRDQASELVDHLKKLFPQSVIDFVITSPRQTGAEVTRVSSTGISR